MPKRIIIIFFLVIAFAFLFWSSISVQNIFYDTVFSVEKYSTRYQVLSVAVFVALSALSAIFSPFSSLPLVPVAIMIWGNSLTAILLLVGWAIGGTVTYFAGYYVGYPLVNRLTSFKKINHYRQKIPQNAEFWLILLFRLAMPAEIPGYVLGIMRYDFSKYILATVLAELPFAVIASYAGNALIENKPWVFVGFIIVTAVFIGLMFYLMNKKLHRENK